jgi:hypothetical protein
MVFVPSHSPTSRSPLLIVLSAGDQHDSRDQAARRGAWNAPIVEPEWWGSWSARVWFFSDFGRGLEKSTPVFGPSAWVRTSAREGKRWAMAAVDLRRRSVRQRGHPPDRLLPWAIYLQNVENRQTAAGVSIGCRWDATSVENRRAPVRIFHGMLGFGSAHLVRTARHGRVRGPPTTSDTQLARAVTNPPQTWTDPRPEGGSPVPPS